MIKPIWAAVGGLALLGTAGGIGMLVASSGGEEEAAVQNQQTASVAATATPGGVTSLTSAATPSPAATPEPPSEAIPADWPTYSDPGGLFTVRYPATWFQTPGQAQFSSYDLSTLTSVRRPPDAIVVEIGYYTAAGSTDCGAALAVNPKSGEGSPKPGATTATLGGLPAWQVIRTQGDPAISDEGLTRIDGISLVYKGYCFLVTAYFTQENPDATTTNRIAGTFEFKF